ncbi:MAG: 3-oxoacyl-[acyl-carrier protein] reductase [Hyphomicrobiaceae bacterium]|jgi:3-oxoacyl-[acyl-carrier protein] reductase
MPRLTKLNRSIRGRTALITGAASGMGRATALLFADEGANVALVDRADNVEEVADLIRKAGGQAQAWQADLADSEIAATVVANVVDHFGALDILVNNAGVSIIAPQGDDSFAEAWETTLSINLSAQARLVTAALPHLEASDGGRIVNIASTEGLGATPGIAAYTASKHGVIGLTRSLAVELGRRGITANCVCPGPILTGMTEAIPEKDRERFARRHVPIGRYGDPEEVAHITLSLVLPAASFINGAVIPVDGGLTIQNV